MALRVLIIDPEISFIVRLRKALDAQQFEARTVRRPMAALEEIKAATYDVAVIDIEMGSLEEIYQTLREYHPKLPVILSGRSEKDAEIVNQMGAQAYINKPYIARNLIAIIEWTLARVKIHPVQQMLDQYWEEVQAEEDSKLPRLKLDEPALPEGSTLADLLKNLGEADTFDPDYIDEDEIAPHQPTPPPMTLPESTAALQTGPIIDEPPLKPGDSVASQVLRLSNSASDADRVLMEAMNASSAPPIRALPSWNTPMPEQDLQKIEDVIGLVPPFVLPPQTVTTYDSISTRPLQIPPIDLSREQDTPLPPTQTPDDVPDEALLQALVAAEDAADTGLQEALRNFEDRQIDYLPPEQERLVEATVNEITQSMGIMLADEADDTDDEADIIGNAALRLTQLSLESTAQGTLLSNGMRIISKNGDLSDETWRDVVAEVADAWQQGNQSSTRLLYRKFKATGQVLLFSTLTVHNLALTMIFSANTSLKIIRRQAKDITEALLEMPDESVEVDHHDSAAPREPSPQTITDDNSLADTAEPAEAIDRASPAARTTPSRPTGLRAPNELKAAIDKITPPEDQQRPARTPGSYTGYALLWLVQNENYALEGDLASAMERWLARSAIANDWDIIDVEIRPSWVNLHIEVPVNTLPSDVIGTLMTQTAQAMQDAKPNGTENRALWSESYSVTTPGRLLQEREIERFMRFYSHS